MSITLQTRNPFLKNNPYFVPQKFYSQQRNDCSISSCYPPSPTYQNYFSSNGQNINQSCSYGQLKPYLTGQINIFDNNQSRQSTLKKRNINSKQNPFFRKQLLPINKNNSQIQHQSFAADHNLDQTHKRLFASRKIETIASNTKIITNTVIPMEIKETHKYLSSELKIKLKSQIYIQNTAQASSMTASQISQIPVSMKRLSLQEQEEKPIPTQITIKGKIYFHQNIRFNY